MHHHANGYSQKKKLAVRALISYLEAGQSKRHGLQVLDIELHGQGLGWWHSGLINGNSGTKLVRHSGLSRCKSEAWCDAHALLSDNGGFG